MASQPEDHLGDFLNYRPPPFPDHIDDFWPRSRRDIIRFFDTHLDDCLVLQRVETLPELTDELAALADDCVTSSASKIASIPSHRFELVTSLYGDLETAPRIFEIQRLGLGDACRQLASSCRLHPTRPAVRSVLRWDTHKNIKPDWGQDDTDDFVILHYALGIDDHLKRDLLPRPTSALLSSLHARYPRFALGVFLAPNAHIYLQEMEDLADGDKLFPWETNSTCVGPPPSRYASKPIDAERPPWSVPAPRVSDLDLPLMSRFNAWKSVDPSAPTHFRASKIVSTPRESPDPAIEHYIQHVSNKLRIVFKLTIS